MTKYGIHSQEQKSASTSSATNSRKCKIETHIMKVYKEASETITVQPGEKMVVSILTHSTVGGLLSITNSSGQSVTDGQISKIAVLKKEGRHDNEVTTSSSDDKETPFHEMERAIGRGSTMTTNEMK